jgi:DNA-binding transcriptional ArsR family regulator
VRELPIAVQPGTGYDLLICGPLIADRTTDRRIKTAPEIRRQARAVDDGALARAFDRIGRDPFVSLLGFAHARTEDPTAANVVAALREAEAREVVLAMVGYYRRAYRVVTPPSVIRDAVDGDRDAIRQVIKTSYPGVGHWQHSLRNALGRPNEEVRDELVTTLARWHETGFGEMEQDVATIQAAHAERVRELVATRELDAVLEELAPGMTFAGEVGQSLVVLSPSALIHPGWAITDFGSNLVILYPVPPGGQQPDEPPGRLVVMAKALGDDLRVRALRELRGGPLTASELARRLDVPRTSLQHHISILVNSGLARVATDDARWGRLWLRPEAIAELSELANAWILADVEPEDERVQGGAI